MGTGDNIVNVPDSYEMPRNTIDLSLSKSLWKQLELKVGVRDLLGEKITYQQYQETSHGDVKQVNRQYRPGRNFSVNISYKF